MSDLPKTREWEYRHKSVFMGQYQPDIDKADAMKGELLARIAEMEAENERLMEFGKEFIWGEEHPTEWRTLFVRTKEAEAALAEFKSRHTAAGCGMDATTGSLHVMTTGVGLINDVVPPDRVEDGEE